MERKNVKSSNIAAIGYNKNAKVLEIEFKHGGIYYYVDVPQNAADGIVNAPSIGKFFHANIRNGFKCTPGEWKQEQVEVVVPNIYICGKAGAGKTYAAKYLMEKCGYIQAKFAFPVYGLAYDYFRMDKKDRKLLQTIGTDSARDAVDKDIWVKRFVEDTTIVQMTRQKLGLPNVGLVCDDTRFLNEKIVLEKNGWVGLYLDVSDEIRMERLKKRDGDAQQATLNHSSETTIDEFKDDLIQIDASQTVEITYKKLDSLIETLKRG